LDELSLKVRGGLVEERMHRFKEVMGNALVHILANTQPFD